MTLAHRGVLFLDELAEFARPALEALRQPLEHGSVEIMRGQVALRFPARVLLVAAANPCPCGIGGERCECGVLTRERYRARLSGPLIDRIDLVCQLAPVPAISLAAEAGAGECSAAVRERVVAARVLQSGRAAAVGAVSNAELTRGRRAPPGPTRRPGRTAARRRARRRACSPVAATTACCASPARSPIWRRATKSHGDHVAEALGYRAVAPGRSAVGRVATA